MIIVELLIFQKRKRCQSWNPPLDKARRNLSPYNTMALINIRFFRRVIIIMSYGIIFITPRRARIITTFQLI